MPQVGTGSNPGHSGGQRGRVKPNHRVAKLAILAVVAGPVVRRIARKRRPPADTVVESPLVIAAAPPPVATPIAPSPAATPLAPPPAADLPLPAIEPVPALRLAASPSLAPVRPLPVITYPNREKPQSKLTQLIVIAILIASVALVLVVTIGGWSQLEGMTGLNFAWCAIYLVIAFYVGRWKRGLLPIAAALAVLLAAIALIASSGAFGTSWFDRAHEGFAAPQSLFGGSGLSPDTLGVLTLVIAPVQALLMVFAMRGFLQGWNVELQSTADRRIVS